MPLEQTLSLIKPDGVARGLIGEVIGRFEKNGLKIKAMKMLRLTRDQARAFYAVHRERPFYDSLTKFMSATDYRQAAPGTIRADFAREIEANIVHGSDAPVTAKFEITFFFNALEQV
jgi:nucleoside-diphosphate kinase